MIELVDRCRRDLEEALRRLDVRKLEAMVQAVAEARQAGRTVFLLGNGGSSATPCHSAGDWAKELRLRTHSLSDNVPILTAFANDVAYEAVFEEQLRIYLSPGDVVIAYSASGNSENVLRAVAYARERGNYTIGLTGDYRGNGGGQLARLADLAIVVAAESMERIEDCHLIINHLVKEQIRSRFAITAQPE